MARTLGIPARVAVGFLEPRAGRRRTPASTAPTTCTPGPSSTSPGAGWVRFEPTPAGRASGVPGYTDRATCPVASPTGGPATPPRERPAEPRRRAAAAPRRAGDARPRPRTADAGTAASRGCRSLGGARRRRAACSPCCCSPRALRRRPPRPAPVAGDPEAAWAELRDTARRPRRALAARTGRRARPATHLVQLLRRAARRPTPPSARATAPTVDPEAVAALDRIVLALERLRYARAGGTPTPTRCAPTSRPCVAALDGGATRGARRRAALVAARRCWPSAPRPRRRRRRRRSRRGTAASSTTSADARSGSTGVGPRGRARTARESRSSVRSRRSSRRRRQRSSMRSMKEPCGAGAVRRGRRLAAAAVDDGEAARGGAPAVRAVGGRPGACWPRSAVSADGGRDEHDHEADDADRDQLGDRAGHQHDDADDEDDAGEDRPAAGGAAQARCRAGWRRTWGPPRRGRAPSARAVAAPLRRVARFLHCRSRSASRSMSPSLGSALVSVGSRRREIVTESRDRVTGASADSRLAGRTAAAPNRQVARSTARSASGQPCSRSPSTSCRWTVSRGHQPLDPDPHQPDPGPLQPEGVVEAGGGAVDLLGHVGGLGQGAGPGDGGEVGEPDRERDRAAGHARRPASGRSPWR